MRQLQIIPHAHIPNNEETQPSYANNDTGSIGGRAKGLRAIWWVYYGMNGIPMQWGAIMKLVADNFVLLVEFGKEKMITLKGKDIFLELFTRRGLLTAFTGLDDKAIETKVTELVKSGI